MECFYLSLSPWSRDIDTFSGLFQRFFKGDQLCDSSNGSTFASGVQDGVAWTQ